MSAPGPAVWNVGVEDTDCISPGSGGKPTGAGAAEGGGATAEIVFTETRDDG
jgi:hypothetical protein